MTKTTSTRQKKTSGSASASSNSTQSFERKLNSDGTVNTKYVDLLEEDKPVAGQKFVCVSFVSPDKILKQKEAYFFEEFLKKWEICKGRKRSFD